MHYQNSFIEIKKDQKKGENSNFIGNSLAYQGGVIDYFDNDEIFYLPYGTKILNKLIQTITLTFPTKPLNPITFYKPNCDFDQKKDLFRNLINSYKQLPSYFSAITIVDGDKNNRSDGFFYKNSNHSYQFFALYENFDKAKEVITLWLKHFQALFAHFKLPIKIVNCGKDIYKFYYLKKGGKFNFYSCKKCGEAISDQTFKQNTEIDQNICPFCLTANLKKSTGVPIVSFYADENFFHYKDQSKREKTGYCLNVDINLDQFLGAILDFNGDQNGLILPYTITPYWVLLIVDSGEDEIILNRMGNIYSSLKDNNIPVLIDDRDISKEIKIDNWKRIGIPIGVVISSKMAKNDNYEIFQRDNGEKIETSFAFLYDKIMETIKK